MSESKDDPKHDSLLREIEEDLRREKYERLWKRYGIFVIAAVVLLVVGVAGYKVWEYRNNRSHMQAEQTLTTAMQLAETDKEAAEQKLQQLIDDAPPGYAMLAAFQRAALLTDAGDVQGARKIYESLQQTAPSPLYRDFAAVRDAMAALAAEALPLDADAIRDRLQPITAASNPWRYSAEELIAIIDMRAGQTSQARDRLSTLASDAGAPPDLRSRAQQLLTQLPQG